MINSVRNTVLAVLNKNNYGYLSPSDFNLYAKQAQLDIFSGYFTAYNEQVLNENLRRLGAEYAGMKAKTEADIEKFFVIKNLTHNTSNKFYLPSLTTTGDELFKLEKVLCYDTSVNPRLYKGEAEKIPHSRISTLNASHLTAPSVLFPAYVIENDSISVYPASSFITSSSVEGHYFRLPLAPKWTYVTLTNGEPMFDQSANDYQDFEIDEDEETMLIMKILQYAGVEIREKEVYTIAKREELLKGENPPQLQ